MKKLFLLSALAGIMTSCMNNNAVDNKAAMNKAKTQRFYDEVINAHNPAMIDSFCSADFTDHNPDPGFSGKGIEDLRANFKAFFIGYPDIHITTNMMVANGDTVMTMLTMTGTNSGPMMGQPPTNKQVNIGGTDILVIKDGKAFERWGYFDNMKMMQQLGLMPEMGAAPDNSKMNEAKVEKK